MPSLYLRNITAQHGITNELNYTRGNMENKKEERKKEMNLSFFLRDPT
jgi:hypothetical protein